MLKPIAGTDYKNCGGYDADSGLDILVKEGTPCVAAAAGTVEYAERGHTPWLLRCGLQPFSVRIRLDSPFELKGKVYSFLWYTHMISVDPHLMNKSEIHVKAGDPIGVTGDGNNVDHLHFGILTDRAQDWPEQCMPWRDIASLIWGHGGDAVQSMNPPAHKGPKE